MAERHDTPGRSESGTEKAKHKAKDAAHEVKAKARDVKDQAVDKAEELAADARELGHDAVSEGKDKARELGDEASRMARSRAEEQKDRLAGGVRTVADAIRHGTDDLPEDKRQYGGFMESVADRVEGVSRYLNERDVEDLTRDARHFAREHTPLFLGGAFALGLAGARFLKSSGSEVRPSIPETTGYRTGPTGYRSELGAPRTGIERPGVARPMAGPGMATPGMGATRGGVGPMADPGAGAGRMRQAGSRTEEWTEYEEESAPLNPRGQTGRDSNDRTKEEGGYA